jgi:hypothetical protein
MRATKQIELSEGLPSKVKNRFARLERGLRSAQAGVPRTQQAFDAITRRAEAETLLQLCSRIPHGKMLPVAEELGSIASVITEVSGTV